MAALGIALGVAACGDDSGTGNKDAALDAGPDATIDGGADAAGSQLFGDWRFKEVTARDDDAGVLRTVGPEDTVFRDDAGTVLQTVRVSGRFSLSSEVFSLSSAIVANRHVTVPDGNAQVQVNVTVKPTEFELPLGNVVPYTVSGPNLVLRPTGYKITLERLPALVKKETMELKGVATLPAGAGAMPIGKPRIALAFVLRGSASRPNDFIVPPNGAGDTNDLALGTTALNPGDPARSFDLSRSGPPLGVERIVFGNAGASLGFIVLYDDKNGNGKLDDLYETSPDEIRGVSGVALVYRALNDPELRESRLRFVPEGWSQGVQTQWFTITSGLGKGIGPLDPLARPVPVDIEATPAASTILVPVGSQLGL